MSTGVKRPRRKIRSEVLREIADRFGVSKDRLGMCVEAFQIFSQDEFKVIVALLGLAESGISLERRPAISREIVQAIRKFNASSTP